MKFIGTGIWCGLMFALSGVFSLVAGCLPSKCTQMVFAIIAACFCLPQVVIAGIGIPISLFGYRSSEVLVAMCSVQLIVSLLEAGMAIASSALACRVICCNSGSEGTAYYTAPRIGNSTGNNFVSLGQAQSGYITVPLNSNAVTSIPMTESAVVQPNTEREDVSSNETPPPKYEDATASKKEDSRANDLKYNRLS